MHDPALLAPTVSLPPGRSRGGAGAWPHPRAGDPRRAQRAQRTLRPHLPGPASDQHRSARQRGPSVTHTSLSTSPPQHGRIPLSELWAMLTPWRGWLALVGVSVLLGAGLELVPPLL